MENKNQTKKLPSFYIALCCCVIAIGVAGFIIQGKKSEPTQLPVNVSETAAPELAFAEDNSAQIPETADIPEVLPTEYVAEIPSDIETDTEDYAYDNPDVVSASVTVNAEEVCEFQNPLAEMSVIFGFCTDNLIYNEYYRDWRTHNGIDITADLGCSVLCVADGTVTDVSNRSYGKSVTIEHPNGFKSVYAQLNEISVKAGDTITQGSVIGTVGESTGENTAEPHLHFELYKDAKPVNPQEYL